MILRILKAEVSGPYLLRLAFSDGTRKTVDIRPYLVGRCLSPFEIPRTLPGWSWIAPAGPSYGRMALILPRRRFTS
jgi:hypothetical protein